MDPAASRCAIPGSPESLPVKQVAPAGSRHTWVRGSCYARSIAPCSASGSAPCPRSVRAAVRLSSALAPPCQRALLLPSRRPAHTHVQLCTDMYGCAHTCPGVHTRTHMSMCAHTQTRARLRSPTDACPGSVSPLCPRLLSAPRAGPVRHQPGEAQGLRLRAGGSAAPGSADAGLAEHLSAADTATSGTAPLGTGTRAGPFIPSESGRWTRYPRG